MDKKIFTYNITFYTERRLKSGCAFSVLLYTYLLRQTNKIKQEKHNRILRSFLLN